MMATSSPLLNLPEIPFRRVLYPAESTSHSFQPPRGAWVDPLAGGQAHTYANDTTEVKRFFTACVNAKFWARTSASSVPPQHPVGSLSRSRLVGVPAGFTGHSHTGSLASGEATSPRTEEAGAPARTPQSG